MPTHHSASAQQQRRIRTRAARTDSYAFFNLLTSPQFLEQVESLLPAHRERLFPPTEALSMFLAQALSADRSCQNAVNKSAIKRLAGALPMCSTATGAYCQARQRLPMVCTLTTATGRRLSEPLPQQWRWRGRRVRLIDGTTTTMPDTAANQAAFLQQRGQEPGLGFPLCRLVGILCLSSGALLNAAIGRFQGKGSDEQTLLRSILDTLQCGDLLLGDALYATYFLWCALRERGIDAVFEQHGARRRSTDFRRGRRLGPRDHLIELPKPAKKPEWMTQADYERAPKSISSTNALFPRSLEYAAVVRQPSTCLRHDISRNASVPGREMVRRRRRFGTDSDGQAERCRAAPMRVSAGRVGRVGGG